MATSRHLDGRQARRRVMVVGGITASGKSRLALAVAGQVPATIINADALQVYRELPILTAQPTPAEAERAPHRLYGLLAADETCSVALWRKWAIAEIELALAANRLPLVVGGTGLYLQALVEGMAPVPMVAPATRAAVRAERERLGPLAFHAQLARLDPVMAARLSPHDTARTLRAYEVVTATGRSLDEWWHDEAAQAPFDFKSVLLLPPRAETIRSCDLRFERMVAEGAVDEVTALAARGLDSGLPALKALGCRELLRHLAGELSLAEAIALSQIASRRYAKRQMTWFRHHLLAALRISAQYSESLLPEIFAFIRHHG